MTTHEELWTVGDIAEFMQFSVSHVRASVLDMPAFPAPIYLTDSGRNPRWFASRVRDWVSDKAE